jgi:hypothetical protein
VDCALRVVGAITALDQVPLDLMARAFYLAGNLHFLRDEWNQAIESYDRTLRLVPGVPNDASDGIGRDAAWNRAIALQRSKEKPPPDAGSDGGSSSDAGQNPDGGQNPDAAAQPDGGNSNDAGQPQSPDAGQKPQEPDAGRSPRNNSRNPRILQSESWRCSIKHLPCRSTRRAACTVGASAAWRTSESMVGSRNVGGCHQRAPLRRCRAAAFDASQQPSRRGRAGIHRATELPRSCRRWIAIGSALGRATWTSSARAQSFHAAKRLDHQRTDPAAIRFGRDVGPQCERDG